MAKNRRTPEEILADLTPVQRQKFELALMELRNRNLVPSIAQTPVTSKTDRMSNWPVDERGFFIKNDGTRYNPTPVQEAFIDSGASRVGMFGGRGAGKTGAGAQKALRKVMQGKSGAVINFDFELMKYSTWPELRAWIPWNKVELSHRHRAEPSWEPSKPFTITFTNGAQMYVKGLKDPESARGPNINWLWYDEAGRDPTGLSWKLATAGVRIGKDAQAWATTTPKGKLHWLYQFFIKQEMDEKTRTAIGETLGDRKLIEYFFASIDDNKDNLSPDFYATMLATYSSGYLRDQELKGEFADAGSKLGTRAWFQGRILPAPPLPDLVKSSVRYWDLASSEKKIARGGKSDDPDYTCGTKVSHDGFKYVIEHQVAKRILWHEIKMLILDTALQDGPEVPIYIEEEPGSGGKNQVSEIASMVELAKYTIKGHRPQGDKVQRANPWFAKAERGLVYLVEGPWNEDFLSELDEFPTPQIHDDRVDSVSGCFSIIAPARSWSRIEFVKL